MKKCAALVALVTLVAGTGCQSQRTAGVLFLQSPHQESVAPVEFPEQIVTHEIVLNPVIFAGSPQALIDAGLIRLDGSAYRLTQEQMRQRLEQLAGNQEVYVQRTSQMTIYEGQVGSNCFIRQSAYIQGYNEVQGQGKGKGQGQGQEYDPIIGKFNYGDLIEAQAWVTDHGVQLQHLRADTIQLLDLEVVNVAREGGKYPIEMPRLGHGTITWPSDGELLSADDVMLIPFRYSTTENMQQAVLAISVEANKLAAPISADSIKTFKGPAMGILPPGANSFAEVSQLE